MSNAVIGSIAQNNTDYNLVQAAKEVTVDILKDELLTTLQSMGAINTDGDVKGDTVNFYNYNRIDSHGLSEADDSYSNAESGVYGQRQLTMNAIKYSQAVQKRTSMTATRAETSVRDLTKGVKERMIGWGKVNLRASLMNQLAGNQATSISVPELATTAFTGAVLSHVTGLNPVTGINPLYTRYGNLNAGAPANPGAITSNNFLTLADFMAVEDIIFNTYEGVTKFQCFDPGQGCKVLAIVSRTGWNQMMMQAPVTTNYASMAFERYQQISANGTDRSRETGKTVNGYRIYESAFTPDTHYLVVEDSVLPQADNAGSAVANTRTALIVGKNAVDMKVGSMLQDISSGAAFSIQNDNDHEKLNNLTFWQLYMKYGIKRTVLEGFGPQTGSFYDNATAIINHYSAS